MFSIIMAVRKVWVYLSALNHAHPYLWIVSQGFHNDFNSELLRLKPWCTFTIPQPDKQQKGEFNIDGYSVKLNSTLRKDSKKDCCFEISAPDKRIYQASKPLANVAFA